jgi:hypothetical protein
MRIFQEWSRGSGAHKDLRAHKAFQVKRESQARKGLQENEVLEV